MHIEVSREDILLDTGGGLKRAAWFFLEVLILMAPLSHSSCTTWMYSHHRLGAHAAISQRHDALARNLAVQDRKRLLTCYSMRRGYFAAAARIKWQS